MILVFLSYLSTPSLRGDSWDYTGMTISIANHVHPNLTGEDIKERNQYFKIGGETIDFTGYAKDLKGIYYSGHFWFYSAVCIPIYYVVKWMGGNPLKTFPVTNTILMIILFWWIIFRSRLEDKVKIWVLLCLLFCPIWLYVRWPHPELFSFVFLFIGLLEFLDKRRLTACLLTSIASFQNPAIALCTLYIAIHEIYDQRNMLKHFKIPKRLVYMGLLSSTVFIPYIWYWYHFRVPSLIAKYSASVESITFAKVVSLFIDPNFGMMIYIPVLFVIFIWLIIKRNNSSIIWATLLIMMSITCATQYNWNSDMNSINRYAVWMIPVVIIGTIPFINLLKKRLFYIWCSILVITSLPLFLFYSSLSDDRANYVTFQPVAKFLLSHAPVLYYSPPEVFIERALGREVPIWDPRSLEENKFLAAVNEQGIRKVFVYKNGMHSFLNGPLSWSSSVIHTEKLSP